MKVINFIRLAKRSSIIAFLILPLYVTGNAQQDPTELGISFYRSRDYTKAIEVLRNAVSTNKKDLLAWTYLGASLLRAGNTDEAIKAFRKSDHRVNKMWDGYKQPVR